MLRVTVMIFKDSVESVKLEMELARERWAGCKILNYYLILICNPKSCNFDMSNLKYASSIKNKWKLNFTVFKLDNLIKL